MTDEMERFDMSAVIDGDLAYSIPDLHLAGEFVRHSDHIAAMQTKDARIAELERLLENARGIERNVQASREHEFQRAEALRAENKRMREAMMEVRGKINHRWQTITGDKCIITLDEALQRKAGE